MMAYEQQPEYKETSAEMRFAGAAFAVAAGLEIAAGLFEMSSMAAWDWIILWRGLSVGLVAGGVAYAVALFVAIVAPGLPALLLKKAEDVTGLDLDGKPNLPTGQPKREPRRVEAQAVEAEIDSIDELPQWIINTDRMVWGDRLNINNHPMNIPDGFKTDWLYIVAEKREAGELDTISPTKLDSLGISRWANVGDSPAAQVVSILETAGCIKSKGDRQPYDWTDAGKKAFPSPTDL